eukprot:2785968-Amphidinium_carterae.1
MGTDLARTCGRSQLVEASLSRYGATLTSQKAAMVGSVGTLWSAHPDALSHGMVHQFRRLYA